MQLYGNSLRGFPIYLSRYPNDRNSICVYGFDHTQSEAIIKKQVREIFKKCGNVLDIFIPTSTSTRSHLGFCYLFIDLSNETASESLAKLSETMAQKGNIRFCYVFLKPWVKKAILDSNGKAVLQKAEAAMEPLEKAKTKRKSDDLDNLNPQQKQKKQSEVDEKPDLKKETIEMKNSFKEMVEATKKLVPTKADLQDCLFKDRDENENSALKKESDENEKTALEKESDEDEKTALKKEIEEMTNSCKEMFELVKLRQKNILTKADLLKYSFKKKVEAKYECCYTTKDAKGNNNRTIFVRGFDRSLPRGDIKSALKVHFSSCGEISRVFVPIECKTGSTLGYAFINLENDEEALSLNGSYLGRLELFVTMAIDRVEYSGDPKFVGCVRCRNPNKRIFDWFIKTCGGRMQPRTPWIDRAIAEHKKANATNHS